MRKLRSLTARLVGAGLLAAATLFVLPPAAQAEAKTVPYLCPYDSDGQTYVLNYERVYDVTAPAKVRPGQRFQITIDNAPLNPLTQFNRNVWDVRLDYQLPAGAKVVGYKLVGGSNLGSSVQTVSLDGNRIALHASGPLSAGQDHDLPNLVITLVAPAKGPLTVTPAGTSRVDTGFRWTADDPQTGEVGDLTCYPDPAKKVTLSTTKVTG